MMSLPRLRRLDAYPVKIDRKLHICLRDPEGIQSNIVLLTPEAFFIAALLDGQNAASDIQAAWAGKFSGEILFSDDISKFVSDLDEKYLLETDNYSRRKQELEVEFSRLTVRPPFHAGKSYPAAVNELRKMFDSFFDLDHGSGPLKDGTKNEGLVGIVVPHIDFQRGGTNYAFAYKELFHGPRADIFVILGVAHSQATSAFILSKKSFDTPLGTVDSDSEFINKLIKKISFNPFEGEIVHRTEHSIEFQVLFLKYLFDHNFTIVPILCSAFEQVTPLHQNTTALKKPSLLRQGVRGLANNRDNIESFICALKDTIKESDKRIIVISGSDLAHVGPRFGDPYSVDDSLISWMSQEDKASLEYVQKVNAEGFYESCVYDGNRRRVCGLSSIYTTLRVLESAKGKLLKYSWAPDPAGGIVSFASVAFYRD